MADAYDILGGPLKVTVEHVGGPKGGKGGKHHHHHGRGRGYGYGLPYYGYTDLDAYVEPVVYVIDTTAEATTDEDEPALGFDAYDILGGWHQDSVGFDAYDILGNSRDRWRKAPVLRRAPYRYGVLADTEVLTGGQTRGQQTHTGSNRQAGVLAGPAVTAAMRANTAFVIPPPDPARPKGKLDGQGWNRPRLDARDLFVSVQKRQPNKAEADTLLTYVNGARGAQKAGDENAFEGWTLRLQFYVKHLRAPRRQEVDAIVSAARDMLKRHVLKYYAEKPKDDFLGDVIHAVAAGPKFLAHGIASGMHAAADLAGKIPLVGEGLHAVLNLPSHQFELIEQIANGDNVLRSARGNFNAALSDAKTVSSYATTVASFVPGMGQVAAGINGAMVAASAIAQGKPITSALVDAVKQAALDALPGGAVVRRIASTAFETGKALAEGKNITQIALEQARAQLPKEAQAAFDTGLAIAQGKKLQTILTEHVVNMAPAALGKFAANGAAFVKAHPDLARGAQALAGEAKRGYHLANGIMAHTGTPEHAIVALRNKLPLEQRRGFDKAFAVRASLARATPRVAGSLGQCGWLAV